MAHGLRLATLAALADFGKSNSDLVWLCAHYDASVAADLSSEVETVQKAELLEAVDLERSVLEDHPEQSQEIETMAREVGSAESTRWL